jgi:hypothetical protein
MPFILRLKRVIDLLEIVDMPVNQARLLCGEMSTLVSTKKILSSVCSRQETFFKGLKDWRILKNRFTYGRGTKDRMEMHKMVVKAIAVIRQYDYENGHPPFEVC